MLSVDQALDHVEQAASALAPRHVVLTEALGLRLAEAIISEIDSPPFDKSMLDGYAVASSDRSSSLRIVEQVIAGGVPHHAVEPGTTILVMTGAPVPEGADAVVKHEDVEKIDDTTIRLPEKHPAAGAGVMPRGASFCAGQEVLANSRRLTSVDIALLAEVGRSKVLATPRPRVAVLATGNELVSAGGIVGPGQICNSNGPMLVAMLEEQNASVVDLGIGRDDADQLHAFVEQGLDADLLLITGGVSAGVMDLVPAVLSDLGVEQIFHKVRMKPGKPLWFGNRQHNDRRTLVFGLPGNPVSTLVSFEIFVKPALRALRGESFASQTLSHGVLTGEVRHRGKRPTYYPCHVDYGDREAGKPRVEPLPWRGSADLAALTRANALARLPEGDYEYKSGEEIAFLSLYRS